MNRDVHAQAFAHGQDIYFGAGKAPGKDALTAHELTHVVQQTGTSRNQAQLTRLLAVSPQQSIAQEIGNDDRGTIHRMKIRNTPTPSTLSTATQSKHVEAATNQQARADAEYGSRTFVTSATAITSVVDTNTNNFTEPINTKSPRFDFNASVPISQYMKTPPDLGAGKPSVQTINNVATNCEIGVVKTGTDQIQVTHFKMA
jgi:Domain of unknown function (DUF4157)